MGNVEVDAVHVYWSTTAGLFRAAKSDIGVTEQITDWDAEALELSRDGVFFAHVSFVGYFSLTSEDILFGEQVPVGGGLSDLAFAAETQHGYSAFFDVLVDRAIEEDGCSQGRR